LTTGSDGVVVFEKLTPGSYSIRVEREGYFATTAIATTLAGQPVTEVSTVLSPGGSISGRVLDAYGVAMPTARVTVGTLGYREGRRIFNVQATGQPDGFGNYVVSPISTGDYFVRMEPAALRGGGFYYPGVTGIDEAVKVPVQSGQEIVGLDFKASEVPTFKVSGTLLNLPANTTALTNLSFVPADPRNADPQTAPLLPNGRRGSTNEFELPLPPGLWDVFPVIPMRGLGTTPQVAPAPGVPTYATGRVRVLVADRDVENVTVTIAASDMKGRIVTDSAAALPNALRVTLIQLDNAPSPLIGHLRVGQSPDANGNFAFNAVPPGRYSLQLTPMPPGLYVADLRLGSKSIYDDGVITVGTEPIEPVEISLRSNGGTVQAAPVTRPVAAAAPRGTSRFVLVPAAPRDRNILLYKTGFAPPANAARGFLFDVAPGDYKLFAFESLPPGGAEQNAEFMEKYQKLGVPVHVEPGQSVPVQVQWIPADQ